MNQTEKEEGDEVKKRASVEVATQIQSQFLGSQTQEPQVEEVKIINVLKECDSGWRKHFQPVTCKFLLTDC